jgi:hypothetical protein
MDTDGRDRRLRIGPQLQNPARFRKSYIETHVMETRNKILNDLRIDFPATRQFARSAVAHYDIRARQQHIEATPSYVYGRVNSEQRIRGEMPHGGVSIRRRRDEKLFRRTALRTKDLQGRKRSAPHLEVFIRQMRQRADPRQRVAALVRITRCHAFNQERKQRFALLWVLRDCSLERETLQLPLCSLPHPRVLARSLRECDQSRADALREGPDMAKCLCGVRTYGWVFVRERLHKCGHPIAHGEGLLLKGVRRRRASSRMLIRNTRGKLHGGALCRGADVSQSAAAALQQAD